MNRRVAWAWGVAVALCGGPTAGADEARHPFLLWTAEEAQKVRATTQSEAWARAAATNETDNLVRYGILGDKAAGETEKKVLLDALSAFQKKSSPQYNDYYALANEQNALRYDVLFDLLSAEERAALKAAFVKAVEWKLEDLARHGWWNRSNWLPNLQYVGYTRIMLVAAATGDRDFIRKAFAAPQGFQWYLDEYLSDFGFYNEEFGKSGWMYEPFAKWCWAMDRLGMSDIGWDYQGRQGATFRGCIESMILVAYPRVDLDRPYYHFGRVTMGDARGGGSGLAGGPVAIFQHRLVAGDVPASMRDQKGLSGYQSYARALEFLYARWPNAGHGYFLVQHRGDGQAYSLPLWFGKPPIEPSRARPPAAPSGVYPGRGLVMLRAEESPAYWESPAPAVSLRLATAYAHHVPDSFALLGFYAFNRPLFVNHSHPTGYTGTDPFYSNSARSHSAVLVDRMEPATLSAPADVRHEFHPRVKFVAARAKGVFPGVDQTRALMLTREYLLDVSRLVSRRARDYLWQIQTFGHACPDNPSDWAESADLGTSLPDLGNERSCATERTWTVTAVQSSGTQHEGLSPFGPRWFRDRIGVRVTMLGGPGTRVYTAWSPVVCSISGEWYGRNRFAYGEDEPAGAAIVVTRRAAATTFVAVHEPFRTTHRIRNVRRVAEDAGGMVVAVEGDTFTDYAMLRFGDGAGSAAGMGGSGEGFVFADHAYVRVAGNEITVVGQMDGMAIPAKAGSVVTVNGVDTKAAFANGVLTFGRNGGFLDRPAPSAESVAAVNPVATRWMPPSALCLSGGGKGSRTIRIRNNGMSAATGEIPVQVSKGLKASPAAISVKGLAPGGETDVAVTVDASGAESNAVHSVAVGGRAAAGLDVQRAALTVAHGVAAGERVQALQQYQQTIYSPRYAATYFYMESGGAMELLDPQGYRRHTSGGNSYPSLVRERTDSQGRKQWETVKAGRHPYFGPIVIRGPEGQPAQLFEGGWHVHGFGADLAHWFTEDWILVAYRRAQSNDVAVLDWLPRSGYRNALSDSIPGRDAELSAQVMPGTVFLMDEQGRKRDMEGGGGRGAKWPKDVAGVSALFVRPDGYEYGSAMFYPPGAKMLDGRVGWVGGRAMAFTFCTEAEFPDLYRKWQADPKAVTVTSEDSGRYRNRGMPLLRQPEPEP